MACPEVPRPPDHLWSPPGSRVATPRAVPGVFRALKPFPSRTLDLGAVGALLHRSRQAGLRFSLDALRSLASFRAHFLLPASAPAPPRVVRQSTLAPHLWAELARNGVVVPLGASLSPLPLSCPIRCVADRKDPTLGRAIFPLIATNAACLPPPPTPTPLLPVLISTVLSRSWVATADFRGWFWVLTIPLEVARAFFAVRWRGVWYGATRGLLGWSWMPHLMASLAQVIVAAACLDASDADRGRSSAVPSWLLRPSVPPQQSPHSGFPPLILPSGPGSLLCPVWVDNLFVCGDRRSEVAAAMRRCASISTAVGADLHEIVAPAQRATAVGLEFVLGASPKWRLAPSWASRFVTAVRASCAAVLSARQLWSLLGGCVWATYATMLPFIWVAPALAQLREVTVAWAAREVSLDSVVTLAPASRAVLLAVASHVARNPWRRLAAPIGRHLFSDAEGGGGLGVVVPAGQGYVSVALPPARPPQHINVLEAQAAFAAAQLAPPQPGLAVPHVIDNTVVVYQWRRGLAHTPDALRWIFLRYSLAASRGEGISLYWVPSALQPADAPSRSAFPFRRPACPKLLSDAVASAQLVGLPVCPVATMPAGWRALPRLLGFSPLAPDYAVTPLPPAAVRSTPAAPVAGFLPRASRHVAVVRRAPDAVSRTVARVFARAVRLGVPRAAARAIAAAAADSDDECGDPVGSDSSSSAGEADRPSWEDSRFVAADSECSSESSSFRCSSSASSSSASSLDTPAAARAIRRASGRGGTPASRLRISASRARARAAAIAKDAARRARFAGPRSRRVMASASAAPRPPSPPVPRLPSVPRVFPPHARGRLLFASPRVPPTPVAPPVVVDLTDMSPISVASSSTVSVHSSSPHGSSLRRRSPSVSPR